VIDGNKVLFILRRAHLTIDESKELRPREAYAVDKGGDFGRKSDFEPGDNTSFHYYLASDCYFDGLLDGEAVCDKQQSIVLL
jgi:hypothetical protein